MPDLNQRGDELDRVKILGMPPRHLWVRQRVWFRSTDTRFFRLDLVDPTSNEVRGLTVLEIDGDFQLLNRLDAARAQWTPEGWVLSAGALTEIDAGARQIRLDGEERTLTSYQFALLLALAQNAGRVLSRDALMTLLKNEALEAFDRSIDVHVSRIRAAIEDDPRKPRRVITVRGMGYVFAKAQD